jgi:hypothetical protein
MVHANEDRLGNVTSRVVECVVEGKVDPDKLFDFADRIQPNLLKSEFRQVNRKGYVEFFYTLYDAKLDNKKYDYVTFVYKVKDDEPRTLYIEDVFVGQLERAKAYA